jgi:hypothetical protein
MPPTMPKGLPGAMLGRHCGRRPPTDAQRKKALPLRPFLRLAGRPVPTTDDYAVKAQAALTKMMDNDAEGCCVATALAKWFGIATGYAPGSSIVVATDQEVSRWYHAVGGPADNGLVMTEAFSFAVKNGFTIGGATHKLAGFASVDPTDDTLVDAACHWFGGLQVGCALTMTQYQHSEDTDTWDYDGSGVVGGHAIPVTMRNPTQFKIATWARQPSLTRSCFKNRSWNDETYVLLGPDWENQLGVDVNGVNVEALTAALAAIAAGGTPDIPPDPGPVPPGPGPGPGPVGPGSISLSGFMDVFGKQFPITLTGLLTQAAAGGQSVNWILVFGDAFAIISAVMAKNWPAVMAAVEKLIADLGMTLTRAEMDALSQDVAAWADTLPLALPRPLR